LITTLYFFCLDYFNLADGLQDLAPEPLNYGTEWRNRLLVRDDWCPFELEEHVSFFVDGKSVFARSFAMILLVAAVLLCTLTASAANPITVTVMTRNMYYGADLNPVIAATDQESFTAAAAGVMEQLTKTTFADRAARLADEIAATNPNLISLQEVSLWRSGPIMAPPATDILYDQLDLLQSALAKRNLHYAAVAVQNLLDAEAPIPSAGIDVRITDRDVMLARMDLPQAAFDIDNAQAHRYKALWQVGSPLLGQFGIPEGWLTADVTVQGVKFRFVSTHLESTCACGSDAQTAQEAQADELVAALADSGLPVIVAGDFNSNAESGPEQTASIQKFITAGFVDAWRAANPGAPGLTWPLFVADLSSAAPMSERIDLVLTRGLKNIGFSRGLQVISAQRTGMTPGAWASDHAGLVVKLQLQ
jgi:endonuclease/exonuclease/phosphatase family metal-dependent hydrolase